VPASVDRPPGFDTAVYAGGRADNWTNTSSSTVIRFPAMLAPARLLRLTCLADRRNARDDSGHLLGSDRVLVLLEKD
jgi:hypothetical protein